MNNISIIHDCYGCGVCSAVCPQKIIDIVLNKNGFYEPTINEIDKCTNCGLCLNVCGFNHSEIASTPTVIKSYAAWSDDKRVQRKCSSGGVGFEIGLSLMKEGYKVSGVKFNADKNRAEHYIASTKEELVQTVGSKYIQSYTPTGFHNLDRKQKYLVTGTPCQIDSFRRMIQKKRIEENFILLDFFCHSVPSMFAWNYYSKLAESKIGKLTYASWRNKTTGWHDSWAMELDGERCGEKVDWQDSYNMLIKGKKGFISSRKSKGDLFYRLFLGDFCCNPACQKNCKYKYTSSSADLRIGDLWGKEYAKNEDGVSALIAFTTKGQEVIKKLDGCIIKEHPLEVVAEGQMKQNVGKAYCSKIMMQCLKHKSPLYIINGIIFIERVLRKLKRLFA